MADRPILFSGPMVRAILEGRKTQTRRILTPQPDDLYEGQIPRQLRISAGDRLWVREAFMPLPMEVTPNVPRPTGWVIAYGAGGQSERIAPDGYSPMLYNYERWTPSIHMPRWASRITLRVTGVKVERLQGITRGDAMAEGCPFANMQHGPDPRDWFRDLWLEINAPDSWAANPWVAAYTFKPIFLNIDKIEVQP